MKSIVILTGSELRHSAFRKLIANDQRINVLKSFCESKDGNLQKVVESKSNNQKRINHLLLRSQSEKDFFVAVNDHIGDKSNPIFINKGDINLEENVIEILQLNPELIISYGCSIIRSKLLDLYRKKFINVHLGLSPYYRGSGTNFWPFYYNELQFVGTTFMHIDKGIDTGQIFHQTRAEMFIGDDIHKIGNRLIYKSINQLIEIISNYELLDMDQKVEFKSIKERVFKKIDFSESSLDQIQENFSSGMIEKYVEDKYYIDCEFPILENTYFKNKLHNL